MEKRDTSALKAAFVFLVGLGALAVALLCVLYAVGIDGRPSDVVVEWNGDLVGSPTDLLVAKIVAVIAGSVGLACVLGTWREVRGNLGPQGGRT